LGRWLVERPAGRVEESHPMKLHLNHALIVVLMTKHPHMTYEQVQNFLRDIDVLLNH